MSTLGTKPYRALRPDAQGFDEVRITTVPRWKESGLSGDEWRISAKMQFLRKGEVCHEVQLRNVETACGFAFAEHAKALDEAKGYFGGIEGKCDQEGCCNPSVVTYRMKKQYSQDGTAKDTTFPNTLRCFCAQHMQRGDCGLEDSDANYEPYIEEGQALHA